MRKIENKKWKETTRDEKDQPIELNQDLCGALSALLTVNRDKLPKGMDPFRTFHLIQHAFEDAKKTGIIELEEAPYLFIKSVVEKEIPPTWGAKEEIFQAVEGFLRAEPSK